MLAVLVEAQVDVHSASVTGDGEPRLSWLQLRARRLICTNLPPTSLRPSRRFGAWAGRRETVQVGAIRDNLHVDLASLATLEQWSPRASFPPSDMLVNRLFKLGDHLYLATNPRPGPDDPVSAVGWAESDYWATRMWSSPPFRGELDPPHAEATDRPGLTGFGSSSDLKRSSILSKWSSWPSNLVMWSRPALSRNTRLYVSNVTPLASFRSIDSTEVASASGQPSNSHVSTVRVGGSTSK
jgi:hypothetical protein